MTVFVGDKPSPKQRKGAAPFEGAACAARLRSWIEYLMFPGSASWRSYRVINQVDLSDRDVQGSENGDTFVALGDVASKALLRLGIDHFKLPHPSGRNRKLNDKKFVEQELREARRYIHGID